MGGAVGLGLGAAGAFSTGALGAPSWEAVHKTTCSKRFASFASQSRGDKSFMTFEDFTVSLCRGEKPESAETAAKSAHKATTKDLTRLFRLFDDNGDNLLSYEEFCVLYTILSTPARKFEMAFKMFDQNDTGSINAKQFVQVVTAMSADPTARLDFGPASGLMTHFFGDDRKRSLKFPEFVKATRQLRQELLKTEYNMADVSGKGKMSIGQLRRVITHRADAEMAAVAAAAAAAAPSPADAADDEDAGASSSSKKSKKSKKERGSAKKEKRAKDAVAAGPVVSQDDYLKVLDVLHDAPEWLRAIELFQAAHGGPEATSVCDRQVLARALAAVGLKCDAREVELLFRLFDADDSGTLEPCELSDAADARRSFFSKYTPDFLAPQRNAVQQFAYCMQQK